MMRAGRLAVGLGFCAAVVIGGTAHAYLKFGTTENGQTVTLRWRQLPVGYLVTNRSAPGVSAADFAAAVRRAFDTWQQVPTANVSFEFGGATSVEPGDNDGRTVLGFDARPDLDRVLGATSYTFDLRTGAIIEADIFFNTTFDWSVAPGGEPGRFDLESIALHEIGHLVGLGHSALGETELRPSGGRRVIAAASAMFPIARAAGSIDGRALDPDDIAGVSDVYPAGDFESSLGSISGRITKNGQGIFGAHVVAFNLSTGRLVANYTLTPQGEYTIAGLDPGPTVLRVEPLDDGDLDSFFGDTSRVDIEFLVTFGRRAVVVPEGGGVRGVDIAVRPK